MKVLIVKLSALGDVAQSLPVAMAIRQQVPQAIIDWLVEEPSAGLLRGHPALRRVLVSPRHALSRDWRAGARQARAFWRELRAERYDAVLDLQGLMKSAIFTRLSRGERRIGFRGGKEPAAAWALNQALPPYDPDRHALERYLDLLKPLGLARPARPEFGLVPSPAELARAAQLLAPLGGAGPLALLHPVAQWESKLWPLDSWVELAQALTAAGVRCAITGSQADASVTGAIMAQAGAGVLDLAGQSDLRTLAALQSLADLVVATDTGAMHLAAAMGRPTLALFGPTSPRRTGPYGQGHRVLRLGLDCQPCFKRRCEQPRCLGELAPGQVAENALAMLAQAGAVVSN